MGELHVFKELIFYKAVAFSITISGIVPSIINSASVEAIICSTVTPGARSTNLNPLGVTSIQPIQLLFFYATHTS
jgi:hypothetical protein